jgi:predicted O-linked N-acetylglucosamine transferase (SPINDLY family)
MIEEFLLNAAQRRSAANDRVGALVMLEELLRQKPDHAPALRMFARLQLAANPVAAANAVHRIVVANPHDAEAMTLLGLALSAMGRADEAVRAFQTVVALRPNDGAAHSDLAASLLRAGDPYAALAAARRAITLAPTAAEPHTNLGHARNFLHQSEEAIAAFRQALALRPKFPDALLGIARAYRDIGRPSTAVAALLRAADLAPDWVNVHVELATTYHEIGEWELAKETNLKALSLSSGVPYFYSNLLFEMQYDPTGDGAEVETRLWGARQVAAVRPVARPESEDLRPDRPLRIGYVSADLYRHPVGWLGSRPIIAHDHCAVTVFVYANQTATDQLTEQIKRSVDAWVPILGLDDDSVAARIAADRVDILMDLSGHTAGNRLAVFARKPAPIQVSWLGYPASTGLATIDYVLFDAHHLIEGADAQFLERVIRLPNIRFCYAPPDNACDVAGPPVLTRGVVTFASFNNAAKINDAVISLWARVLKAVPRSTLLLKWRSFSDPFLQGRVRADFAAYGVDGQRIRFDGATPHPDMLRQYRDVDIALDPFPFSGGLTTCEALWMGVPVVTLPGARPLSRQTHAVLHAIGRPEWSASSDDDYVAIAARLARDPTELSRSRHGLREQLRTSPLCDAPRFARDLEAVYRKMWHAYLRYE